MTTCTRRINCYTDQVFQVDAQVPNPLTGVLGTPTAGQLAGLTVRIAATRGGPAIHPSLDNLPAQERAGKPGRFYVAVDAALLITHLLPLGIGTPFYVIWSKAGDFDREVLTYLVWDSHDL